MAQIKSQLDSGVILDDVDVDLRLSVLKPIHATWIVSMYNHLSSSEGRQSIAKGWKKAGVTDVVSGSKKLSPEDPFEDQDDLGTLRTLGQYVPNLNLFQFV